MQPDFLIAGATRGGTSTLHAALSRHPHIYMPPEKELQFFYRDRLYQKGFDFYCRNFKSAKAGQMIGEASPPYMEKGMHLGPDNKHVWDEGDDCPARIARHLPDAKIILSLRDPVSRAYSIYWKQVWQGREDKSFNDVIAEELSGERTPQETSVTLLYRNHYKIHLENWLRHFPQEQILLLVFEEWIKSPATAIRQVEDFLGLEHAGMTDTDVQAKNEGRGVKHPLLKPLTKIAGVFPPLHALTRRFLTNQGYPKLSDEEKAKLAGHFVEDRAYIEEWLGRPLPWVKAE